MKFRKAALLVFVSVIAAMTLWVTVSKAQSPRTLEQRQGQYQDRIERYPVAELTETESPDPSIRERLKLQQTRYNEPAFSRPGPKDELIEIFLEDSFKFPALPINESDVVVIGQVLGSKAHRSENKLSVFGDYQVRVDEVLKGTYTLGQISFDRVGGFVKYPNGKRVLFKLVGHGAPEVGARYVFFLKAVAGGYNLLTAYELGSNGVQPLDNSQIFRAFQNTSETDFLTSLRTLISQQVR